MTDSNASRPTSPSPAVSARAGIHPSRIGRGLSPASAWVINAAMAAGDQGDPILVAGVTRIEKNDFLGVYAATRALRRVTTMLAVFSVWPLTFAAGALAAFVREGDPGFAVKASIALAGSALLAWLIWGLPRMLWRRVPEWQRQTRFELTDLGLRTRTEKTSVELEWSLCSRWQETADAFYVEHRKQQVQIIPKRAFATDDEIALVRDTFRRKIGLSDTLLPRRSVVWAMRVAYAVLLVSSIACTVSSQAMYR